MDNLSIYNKVRNVPNEAQKPIQAGRLKGMTDINPMWRLKILTEQFGPCGFGWYYEITKQWLEEGSENQKVAFTNINLYVKFGEEWSKPIQGTGGSSFIAKEKAGLYTSDECFKMSLTDAISVACKSLGIGADIYFEKDKTKYTSKPSSEPTGEPRNTNKGNTTSNNNKPVNEELSCEKCSKEITKNVGKFSFDKYGKKLCMDCQKLESKVS